MFKVFSTFWLFILLTAPFVTAAQEMPPVAKDATVNLYCRVKIGGKTLSTTGSGVIISERGVILTNAHVGQFFLLSGKNEKSKGNCSVRTGSPAQNAYGAKLLYLSPDWVKSYIEAVAKKQESSGSGERDFALLYITEGKKGDLPSTFPHLPLVEITSVPAKDSVVGIAGYPAENLDFKKIHKELNLIYATSTLSDTRSYLKPFVDVIILNPTEAGRPGVSGGPILNTKNEVIGIATAIETGKKKSLRRLRAITLTHVDRIIRADTGLSLPALLLADFNARSQISLATIPAATIKTLEKTFKRLR